MDGYSDPKHLINVHCRFTYVIVDTFSVFVFTFEINCLYFTCALGKNMWSIYYTKFLHVFNKAQYIIRCAIGRKNVYFIIPWKHPTNHNILHDFSLLATLFAMQFKMMMTCSNILVFHLIITITEQAQQIWNACGYSTNTKSVQHFALFNTKK